MVAPPAPAIRPVVDLPSRKRIARAFRPGLVSLTGCSNCEVSLSTIRPTRTNSANRPLSLMRVTAHIHGRDGLPTVHRKPPTIAPFAVPAPVFVDVTGRRRRLVRRCGLLLTTGSLIYLPVVAIALLSGPTVPTTGFPVPGDEPPIPGDEPRVETGDQPGLSWWPFIVPAGPAVTPGDDPQSSLDSWPIPTTPPPVPPPGAIGPAPDGPATGTPSTSAPVPPTPDSLPTSFPAPASEPTLTAQPTPTLDPASAPDPTDVTMPAGTATTLGYPA
jgi:hypothetical protein